MLHWRSALRFITAQEGLIQEAAQKPTQVSAFSAKSQAMLQHEAA